MCNQLTILMMMILSFRLTEVPNKDSPYAFRTRSTAGFNTDDDIKERVHLRRQYSNLEIKLNVLGF